MCVFERSKLDWELRLDEVEAERGFKWLKRSFDGGPLVSQFYPAVWEPGVVLAARDHWGVAESLGLFRPSAFQESYGFYAWADPYRTQTPAVTRPPAVLVEVKLWGHVRRFHPFVSPSDFFSIPSGFMATRAMLVRELLTLPSPLPSGGWVDSYVSAVDEFVREQLASLSDEHGVLLPAEPSRVQDYDPAKLASGEHPF